MKKTVFIIAAMLTAVTALAKDHKIVVKGDSNLSKGNTEVFVDPTGYSDSIIITPATDASNISVTIKSIYGDVLYLFMLPTDETNEVEVNTPDFPEGYVIEIEDNSGVVYSEIE